MIYFKLWILWLTFGMCYAVLSKKDSAAISSLRDTIELASAENPGSVGGPMLTEPQKVAVLQLHNAFRSMVKPVATNMLKMAWDKDLEKIASDFANKCIVAHNPDRHKLARNYDWVGENIAWGTGSCGDKECGDVYEGVKRWFSESKSYNYLTGQCSGKCTLYTQMVWWESNKLGCGAKKCGDRTILVCNYAPGGNYVGQRPYKTGKPCADCPAGMVCEDNLCTEKKSNIPEVDTKVENKTGNVEARILLPTASPTVTVPPFVMTLQPPMVKNSLQGSHMLPAGWIELPMRLTQVDSGITPFIWGMNGRHNLFFIEESNQLTAADGTMHHVTAGQAGVWAVGLLGNVFFRRGVTSDMPKGVQWEKIPGNLKQIDSGPTGVVWGVNRYNRIFCRVGMQEHVRPEGSGWMRVEGNMKYVSCGEYGCWAVNKRDNIYFRVGVTPSVPQGTQWVVVPGKLRMIESGPAGIVVGLSDTSDLFVREGVTQEKPEGEKWVKLEMKLAHVTVGERGIMGILPDGTIAVHQDITVFQSTAPTVMPTTDTYVTQNLPLDAMTLPTGGPSTRNPPTLSMTKLINSIASEGKFQPQQPSLADSLAVLSQLGPQGAATTGNIVNDRDKLHITPDMAARILKLIEQKGNQFEDDHRAAAEASIKNNTAADLYAKSDESNIEKKPLSPPLLQEATKATSESENNITVHEKKEGTDTEPQKVEEISKTPLQPPSTHTTTEEPPPPPSPPPLPATHSPATDPSATHPPATHPQSPTHQPPSHPYTDVIHPASDVQEEHENTAKEQPHAQLKFSAHPTTSVVTHQKHILHSTLAPVIIHPAHTHVNQRHTTPDPANVPKYPEPKLPPIKAHAPIPSPSAQPPTPKPTTRPHTTAARTTPHILKTGTHPNWVHSLEPSPTQIIVQKPPRPTYAAPHALSMVTGPNFGLDRAKMKAHKFLGKAKSINMPAPAAMIHTTNAAPEIHTAPIVPATVSWELTRSCCAIPDSVCPIPEDCIGYIECHGYRGNYKSCERGKMFNPITNICDYPRNVDCESVKSGTYKVFQQKISVTEQPVVAQQSPSLLQPAQMPVQVPAVPTNDVIPQLSETHEAAAQRDEPQKTTSKNHESNQPRVNQPHRDDDGVLREVWFGLGLSPLLTLLTNNPRFPTNPDEYIVLDKFEAPPNAGDGYGQRLSTYYKAPETGEYTFYISCDNECELWVSPDTEEIHSNLILELKHGHFTSFRQWHKYADEQTSRPIFLQQGEYYFIESFMKEGAGGDDLSVGVRLPSGEFDLPISKGLYLVPGDTGSNSRKPGAPVQASLSQTTKIESQQPAKIEQPQTVSSEPELSNGPPEAVVNQQNSKLINNPMQPELMGPQSDQSAEQWVASNNKQSGSQGLSRNNDNELVSVANNQGNIPGAEMYMNHADDLEAFEQGQQQLASVKRSNIIHPKHTAIK